MLDVCQTEPSCTVQMAAAHIDITCDDQISPEDEPASAVNPDNPNHLVAGSNDHHIFLAGATLQAHVPTGYLVSFEGGKTWMDGQVPEGSGSGGGNGDPSPAFNRKFGTVRMAQLNASRGTACGSISVSVATSADGGLSWGKPGDGGAGEVAH
jgi:hypothetical protein